MMLIIVISIIIVLNGLSGNKINNWLSNLSGLEHFIATLAGIVCGPTILKFFEESNEYLYRTHFQFQFQLSLGMILFVPIAAYFVFGFLVAKDKK